MCRFFRRDSLRDKIAYIMRDNTTKVFLPEAVILAGGLGTRLRQLVNDRPKVLAEINKRPFITYLMDRLADTGISRVILCTGYMGEMIENLLGRSYRSMEIHYSLEQEPMGTGGALKLALPLLQNDPVIVMNGDSFCEVDLAKMIFTHQEKKVQASIAVISVADVSRYGNLFIDDQGKIIRFEEKGLRKGKGQINAGTYIINREVITEIPSNQSISLETAIFPKLAGHGLYGFITGGKFIDIGVPEDYFYAQQFFAGTMTS